jgi:sRNA-binding regulator protein Hfq
MPKSKAPAQTFEEPYYLAELVATKRKVRVHLSTGESYEGTIEYWDAGFVRLSRTDGPNLFLYKHDICYIAEL